MHPARGFARSPRPLPRVYFLQALRGVSQVRRFYIFGYSHCGILIEWLRFNFLKREWSPHSRDVKSNTLLPPVVWMNSIPICYTVD